MSKNRAYIFKARAQSCLWTEQALVWVDSKEKQNKKTRLGCFWAKNLLKNGYKLTTKK